MDIYTLALSIAYSNKIGKQIKDQAFKTQIESNRDILNTTGEEKIFYFLPKENGKPQNGYDEYIYFNNNWELMGGTDIDLSNYMTLAPLNPTAEQIAALPSGQLYSDTANHKGVIKDGQKFYDTEIIDKKLQNKQNTIDQNNPILLGFAIANNIFERDYLAIVNGFLVKCIGATSVSGYPVSKARYKYTWARYPRVYIDGQGGYDYRPIEREVPYEYANGFGVSKFVAGDIIGTSDGLYVCRNVFGAIDTTNRKPYYQYTWEKFAYTKTEIDQKGYLTLETLPIYDGTVI